MPRKDLRRLSSSELGDELKEARQELFDLRFQLATRQLKNVRALPAARKRIARALTAMRQREMEASGSSG